MKFPNLVRAPALLIVLGVGLVACAPQQPPPSAAAQPASASPAMPGHNMAGMQGMSAADHQAMMTHCAQMRQSVRQGATLSPSMQQMMAQCDAMDRSMGMSPTR